MGTTFLDVQKKTKKRIVTRFSAWQGGAKNWTYLVDWWGHLLEKHAEKHSEKVAMPDGLRSLGRGARRICSIEVCTLALAEYLNDPEAKKAKKKDELWINIAPFVLKRMRLTIRKLKKEKD
jgi:hypothetical protein